LLAAWRACRMSKPLLLGEAPARSLASRWEYPLSGPVAKKLCQLAGLAAGAPDTDEEPVGWWYVLRNEFDTMNACERYEDAYPWDFERAKDRWIRFLLDHKENPVTADEQLTVVCLGRKAAAAVGSWRPWGEWHETRLVRSCVIPHPSGRTREYNDPETRNLAGRVLRQAREWYWL